MLNANELRAIPGFEGLYSVSADGRVWSHPRMMGPSHGAKNRRLQGRWLKAGSDRHGYLVVSLMRAGKKCMLRVHRAVALAWVQNPEGKSCTNHLDGNKQNNAAANLEWCTVSENTVHAVRMGLCNTFQKGNVPWNKRHAA